MSGQNLSLEEMILQGARKTKQSIDYWKSDKALIEQENIDLAGNCEQSVNELAMDMLVEELNKCFVLCGFADFADHLSKQTIKELSILRRELQSIQDDIFDKKAIENARKLGASDCVERIALRKKVKLKTVNLDHNMYTDEDLAYIDGWNIKLTEIKSQTRKGILADASD